MYNDKARFHHDESSRKACFHSLAFAHGCIMQGMIVYFRFLVGSLIWVRDSGEIQANLD